MKSYFVIDVESIGLHGEAFAVAGGVYLANGAPQWEFCYAIPLEEAKGNESDRNWVKANVPQIEVTHRSGIAMREAFFQTWMRAKNDGAEMAADCLWPVEARFVAAVIDDCAERNWLGPYPFHEISSYLAAAGFDPLGQYERTASELPKHNPLADARQSARMLAMALKKLKLA